MNSSFRRLLGRWELVMRFAAASFIVFVAIGAGLFALMSHQIIDQERQKARDHAEFVTNSILRYELTPKDLSFFAPMKGRRYEEFLAFVQARILQYPVVLVKLWRSDGTIVFSNDEGLVGQRYEPLDDELREAFSTRMTASSVSSGREGENGSTDGLPDQVLETYVPVFIFQGRNEGPPVAVVETYTDYAVVQSQIDRLVRSLLAFLGGGLLVMFILLIPIARRVSHRLEDQAERLRELLAREQDSQFQRRGLLDRTLRAAEEERSRLAAEIHDGPVQRLARIGYGLERVRLRGNQGNGAAAGQLMSEMQEAVFDEVRELRQMMSRLRPPVLDQRGLEAALQDRADAITSEFGIDCVVEASLQRRLPPSLETVLYNVSQEALQNVIKHAGARHARVALSRENGSVLLEVRDDGSGFEPTRVTNDEEHYGLLAMRERVEMAGGSWEIESRPGEGTLVKATLPAAEVDG